MGNVSFHMEYLINITVPATTGIVVIFLLTYWNSLFYMDTNLDIHIYTHIYMFNIFYKPFASLLTLSSFVTHTFSLLWDQFCQSFPLEL